MSENKLIAIIFAKPVNSPTLEGQLMIAADREVLLAVDAIAVLPSESERVVAINLLFLELKKVS